jgi:electron transfer flavoprotein alpha subunit
MANILVFAEVRGGEPRKVALEATSAARRLADASGGEVHAILVGTPGIADRAPALAKHGADVVLVAEHVAFGMFNGEAITALISARATAGGYRALIFSASVHGRELAPRVAARLGAGYVADVVGMELQGDALVARHPVNTGKLTATLAIAGSPAVVSVRPGMFALAEQPRSGRVEHIAPVGDPAASRVVVTALEQGTNARLDLSEAPIIVSGGRGLKAPENFQLLEDLASAFGRAAVGCTRAVSDDGWRPHSDQIGQTGRTVSPDLYLALGISGAVQHLAGMRTSRTIVAVNKDREAPIFKIADYGIVGDVLEIVPALTTAVREARKGH